MKKAKHAGERQEEEGKLTYMCMKANLQLFA